MSLRFRLQEEKFLKERITENRYQLIRQFECFKLLHEAVHILDLLQGNGILRRRLISLRL